MSAARSTLHRVASLLAVNVAVMLTRSTELLQETERTRPDGGESRNCESKGWTTFPGRRGCSKEARQPGHAVSEGRTGLKCRLGNE